MKGGGWWWWWDDMSALRCVAYHTIHDLEFRSGFAVDLNVDLGGKALRQTALLDFEYVSIYQQLQL
jgi:hypothetical protein